MAQTLDASVTPPESGAESSVQVVQRLGRFVLLRKVGAGGMGTVFAAYDEQLDRKVALKLLHTAATSTDERLRVLREAQAMARVSHPNVVRVYDIGEISGRVFIAMEYIEGTTLSGWQKTPQSWQDILRLYQQAGSGLLAAHRTGLVHRDFKPDNVLLDSEQRAHVADFGLAFLHDKEAPTSAGPQPALDKLTPGALNTPLTAAGTITGTPGYMSPEQYRGEPVDSRSDQFSFCVALYEALYQQLPFSGSTVSELAANTIAGHLQARPAKSRVPVEIHDALRRGLAADPEARFPSMAELLAALELDERDPARGRSTRRRISATLLIACGLLAVAVHSRTRALLPIDLVSISAVTIGLLVIITLVFRRALQRNGFARELMTLSLIATSSALAVRTLGWQLHLVTQQILPIDLMVMGGFMAMMSYRRLPGLALLALVLISASIFEVLQPQYVEKVTKTVYAVMPVFMVVAWMRTAKKQPAARHPT